MSALKTFLLLLFCYPLACTANNAFVHITVEQGLPSSTVYHAMQDAQGFIWFCTETGVSRYDGKEFQNFTVADGLADNEIFKCLQDSKGRIWFLSHNGKVSYYLKGGIYNAANSKWLSALQSKGTLADIVEDQFHNIWLLTSLDEVVCIADTLVKSYTPTFSTYIDPPLTKTLFLQHGRVKKYIPDASSRVILTDLLSGQGENVIDYRSVKKSRLREPGLLRADVNYLPSIYGVFVQDGTACRLLPSHAIGAKAKIHTCLYEDRILWVATAGDGVLRVSDTGVARYLDGGVITSLLKDNEGNFWATTLGGGVYVYRNNSKEIVTLSQDLTHSIAIIKQHKDTRIVTGLSNGALKVIGRHKVDTIQLSQHEYNRILDIIPLQDSRVLACSDKDIYLCDIDSKSIKPLNIRPYKNYERLGGSLWLCTSGGASLWQDGQRVILENKMPFSRQTAVAPVTGNDYYMGTTKGLYKVEGHKVTCVLDDTVLAAGIKDLKIFNGQLWVATHGNGIFILEKDTVRQHYTAANSGIAGNFCEKIYIGEDGYIWIACDKGVIVFSKTTSEHYYNITNSQLLSADVKDIVTDAGYVYIATAKGVNRMEINKVFTVSDAPHVYITKFRKENHLIADPGHEVVFDYFNGSVNVGFTVATFTDPENVLYEYKVQGEEYWHGIKHTELPFFSLKPGRYDLLLRAKKYNSAWGVPTQFSIVVSPLFYQTIWFRVVLVVVAILLLYLFVMKRIAQVRRREIENNATQKRMIELESKTLSCQMNPHFIFNSLNTIQQFILVKEEEQGLNYLSEFAALMRQILENSQKVNIALKEELVFLERYLQLEQIRYSNRFRYTISIDPALDTEGVKIPPVLFQPLLENAIKHGISSLKDGLVSFSIRKDEEYIIGTVEDNGKGIHSPAATMSPVKKVKDSSALKILEDRLRLIKNNKGKPGYMTVLDKSSCLSRGTLITINIPI